MSDSNDRFAPGWPGIQPRWTSSAKSGIGTALNPHSRVWYTVSHGILNEVYFPRVDQACTRDLGLIITDGHSYFSEEKRHCSFENAPIEPGIPVYQLHQYEPGRALPQSTKKPSAIPYRNVVLQRIKFEPRQGKLADYRCYALLAPHIANWGFGNTWLDRRLQGPLLCCLPAATTSRWHSLASHPWLARSVGLRRILRRLAGSLGTFPAHLELQPRGKWQPRADRRRSISPPATGSLCSRSGLRTQLLGGRCSRSCLPCSKTADEIRDHFVRQWRNWHDGLLALDQPKRDC